MHQSSIRNQSTYYTQFAHPWSYPGQAEYAMGVAAATNYSTYFTNAPPEALEVDARWPCRYSSRERIREVVRHRYEGTRSEIHDRIRKLSAAYTYNELSLRKNSRPEKVVDASTIVKKDEPEKDTMSLLAKASLNKDEHDVDPSHSSTKNNLPIDAALTGPSPPLPAKRGRKKRPKDFPKRPLSGYNLYFKEQRAMILADEQAARAEKESCEEDSNDDSDDKDDKPKQRKGRPPPHGKIGFENLALLISKR
jgi:hypothetical protein